MKFLSFNYMWYLFPLSVLFYKWNICSLQKQNNWNPCINHKLAPSMIWLLTWFSFVNLERSCEGIKDDDKGNFGGNLEVCSSLWYQIQTLRFHITIASKISLIQNFNRRMIPFRTCLIPILKFIFWSSKLLAFDTSLKLFAWIRDGGMRGLFTGIGPRIARAGPSVGIVVSFYEVVKYALHQRYLTQWSGATPSAFGMTNIDGAFLLQS